MDVARKHNLCVIDVGEKIGDVIWDRLRIELHNQPFSEIESHLFRLLALRQLKRACIDASLPFASARGLTASIWRRNSPLTTRSPSFTARWVTCPGMVAEMSTFFWA